MVSFPVIEIFGPTVQGEGVMAGLPTHFVRFGGCDYRCSWCDSMYAVEPAQVKANAEKLTGAQIVERVQQLGDGPDWVTFSGGNPALLDLAELTQLFQSRTYQVAVETQGSRWRDWLRAVDCLTVSPKPPSSSMSKKVDKDLDAFMGNYRHPLPEDTLKIVVFDEADLEWSAGVFDRFQRWPRYLSVGTDPIGKWGTDMVVQEGHAATLKHIAERYEWLCDRIAGDKRFAKVRVLPQLHVVAYGHKRGV